jgi:hypothetical protein
MAQPAQEPPPLSLAEAMGQRVPPTREQPVTDSMVKAALDAYHDCESHNTDAVNMRAAIEAALYDAAPRERTCKHGEIEGHRIRKEGSWELDWCDGPAQENDHE